MGRTSGSVSAALPARVLSTLCSTPQRVTCKDMAAAAGKEEASMGTRTCGQVGVARDSGTRQGTLEWDAAEELRFLSP